MSIIPIVNPILCSINDMPDESILNSKNLPELEHKIQFLYTQFSNTSNTNHDIKFNLLKNICNIINLNSEIIDINQEALLLLFNFLLESSAEYLVIEKNDINYIQQKKTIRFCDLLINSVNNNCHENGKTDKCPKGFNCSYHNYYLFIYIYNYYIIIINIYLKL